MRTYAQLTREKRYQMFLLLTFAARQPVRRGLHDFLVSRSRSHRLA
jgi:hypothetical protein